MSDCSAIRSQGRAGYPSAPIDACLSLEHYGMLFWCRLNGTGVVDLAFLTDSISNEI